MSSINTFDAEWEALCAILDKSSATGKSMETALGWLAKLAEATQTRPP